MRGAVGELEPLRSHRSDYSEVSLHQAWKKRSGHSRQSQRLTPRAASPPLNAQPHHAAIAAEASMDASGDATDHSAPSGEPLNAAAAYRGDLRMPPTWSFRHPLHSNNPRPSTNTSQGSAAPSQYSYYTHSTYSDTFHAPSEQKFAHGQLTRSTYAAAQPVPGGRRDPFPPPPPRNTHLVGPMLTPVHIKGAYPPYRYAPRLVAGCYPSYVFSERSRSELGPADCLIRSWA